MDASIGIHPRASSMPGGAATPDLTTGPDDLTVGELRVLRLLARGASNREIATHAEISENTVKFHLKNVYGKLGVSSRAAAVFAAVQRGIVASQ
jgi:LuxR family maltose regulon positive regulatory protein